MTLSDSRGPASFSDLRAHVARGGTPFPRYWSETDSDERSLQSQACDHARITE